MRCATAIILGGALGFLPRLVDAGANRWTQVGPDGGSVSSIAIDPTSPGTVYATGGTGLFRTADGGHAWSGVALPHATSGVVLPYAVAVDPFSGNVWIFSQSGAYRSGEGGHHWTAVAAGSSSVWDVAFSERTPGVAYGISDPGIWKTTDAGDHWSPTALSAPVSRIVLDPFHDDRVLAIATYLDPTGTITFSRVFRTVDSGASWAEVRDLLGYVPLVADPGRPSTFYLLDGDRVSKSTDGGGSWSPVAPLPDDAGPVDLLLFDGDILLAGGGFSGRIFASRDGGESWTERPAVPSVDIVAMVFDPADSSVGYFGSARVGGHADPGAPAGIYKTVDTGTSWSRSDEGFRATLVDLLAIDPLDPATIYGTLETEDPQRLLKTSDGGEHWAATGLVAGVAYGKIDALALDPGNGMILYASTAAGLMRSLDGGGHWQTAGLSSPVFQIEIHPAVPGLLYAVGDAGLASTEDGGAHWRTVSVPEGAANSITIDPSDPGVLYVVTVTPERARLWSSSDRGGSWEPLPAPYSPGRLTVDPFDSSTLYLEAAGFFRSTDRGAHWVPGDATAAVFHIAADRTREGTLYARSWSPDGFRVARTLDGGMHWAPFDQGLDSAAIVTSFLIDSTGRHLYAGTAGGSAWAFDFVPGRSIISTRTSSPDRVFRPRPLPPIHGRP